MLFNMMRYYCLLVFCIIGLQERQFAGVRAQSSEFKCTSAGTFADPNDCRGFYVCDRNLRVIYGTCTAFGRFDPVDTCVWERCTNPTLSPQTFKCPGIGYYSDPTDCHSFYSCDRDLTPTRSTCTAFGYFLESAQECRVGACPTAPVTLSSTTASTTTKRNVSVFQCPSQGIFADPGSCRAFYLCTASGEEGIRQICMGGAGRFVKSLGGCEFGKC